MRRPSFALVLVALAAASAPLRAQQPARTFLTLDGREPVRPRLEAGADTNDARAYNDWAHARSTPDKKRFDGFYWAMRLDPDATHYWLNMSQSIYNAKGWDWQRERINGADFVVKSRESRLIDSLETMAYYRDPFTNLFAKSCVLDRDAFEYYKDDPFWSAWYYHVRGCYTQAAEGWSRYLAKNPGALGVRLDLVRAYVWTRQYGNALREIDVTLDSLRARDAKRTYRFYISREMLETMRGDIYEAQEDYFNAKKAYGKALEENLTYWPAHVRLARAAIRQNELPEALQEFEQAAQLAPDEAIVHFEYGGALLRADRNADAEREYRRTLELEPHFALAHLNLAMAVDRQGRKDDALLEYRAYAARAPRRQARQLLIAQQRIAALGGAMTAEAK